MFERIISLIGKDKFNIIKKQKILLIGLGGVGGYALEALVRTGFINITIIDYDTIEESNLNRQIITNKENIGKSKVKEAKKRALLINKEVNIRDIDLKLDDNNILDILKNNYDYILDACDTTLVKFLLMKYKNEYDYKLISSMGTAKKLDPSKLKITTLDKTSYDPLARKLREMVKKEHLKGKFNVVCSNEVNQGNKEVLGSLMTVPAVCGILMVSFIINDILNYVKIF